MSATHEVQNWSGNQRCVPESIVVASSTATVAGLAARASSRRSRLKAIGAGHSFTAAAMTDGTLVRLDGLDAVESLDPATGVAVVGAGITLHRLSRELDERGRALPNLGDIDVQTVAGATSTATHGTGRRHGNVSTGIVGFEIVTGAGEALWCDASTEPELFRFGRVGVGALGIVTRVAIATVPAFNLRARESGEPVDGILDDWAGFRASADHPEFFWLPGSPLALVKRNDRTTEPIEPLSRARFLTDKILKENVAFGLSQRLVRRFPATRDRVARTIAASVAPSERVDKSFRVFASPRRVKFLESEYGVPVDALPEAFARVRRLAESLDLPPAFPVEVRCSRGDDIPLSTAHGRDTGWIAVHQYVGMPYGDYFRGVEAIMADYEGRPHWGKHHTLGAGHLAARYPEWEGFVELRARLDPHGIFANDYLDRCLGPVGARGGGRGAVPAPSTPRSSSR